MTQHLLEDTQTQDTIARLEATIAEQAALLAQLEDRRWQLHADLFLATKYVGKCVADGLLTGCCVPPRRILPRLYATLQGEIQPELDQWLERAITEVAA